jgi:tetraacyldisaccharide 4'-kinase
MPSMSILPDADTFKRLADGSLPGPGPAAARALLATLALPYALAVAVRNAAYDRGWLATLPAPVPVISVGNLTLGGTGKTPLVAWVVRTLVAAGHRPAVVSRGYGARPGERSDEAAELAVVLPGIAHVANRDRVAGARAAAGGGADVVVLDDGFQHRRLRRDLDIVAVDATDPFGCGRLFPRGLLREPLSGLTRAGAVVLTRASAVDAARRAEIRDALDRACGGRLPAVWMETEHRPVALRSAAGHTHPLDAMRGRRVAAFAGIGNPAAFRATLERLGGEVVDFHAFADHHAYDDRDALMLAGRVAAVQADIVATTLKDLVKLPRERLGETPLLAVEIAMQADSGAAELATLIAATCGRHAGHPGDSPRAP